MTLNEARTRSQQIDPQLQSADWKLNDRTQVRLEVPVDGYDAEPWNGVTDYCLYDASGSVLAVVEAKREDIIGGLGQCAAAMVAIREFNARDRTTTKAVFGCVTSGSNWRFLRLAEGCLSIDRPEYYLHDVGKVIAIVVHIIGTGVRA